MQCYHLGAATFCPYANPGECSINGMQTFPTLTSACALMGLQYSWRLSVSVLLKR